MNSYPEPYVNQYLQDNSQGNSQQPIEDQISQLTTLLEQCKADKAAIETELQRLKELPPGTTSAPSSFLSSISSYFTRKPVDQSTPQPVLGPDGKPVESKKWGFLGFGGKSRRKSRVGKRRKTKLNVAKRSNRVLNNKR
jgi:hypothetical protein